MRRKSFRKFGAVLVVLSMVVLLVACGSGKKKWLGTYGGTSSSGNKVSITIKKDGTVEYNKNGKVIQGTWEEKENSILMDFDGEVSSSSEPLIVTLSSDKQMITVESDNSGWDPDYYQKR